MMMNDDDKDLFHGKPSWYVARQHLPVMRSHDVLCGRMAFLKNWLNSQSLILKEAARTNFSEFQLEVWRT